jgi:MinD-like ATPase involved in chromosome partitioning or flagellar assembly
VSISVLIAVRGPREATVAAAVGAAPDLRVARRCADLGEALAAAHAGVGAAVVVSEQPQLHRGVVAEFMAAGVAVIGSPGTHAATDHLRSIGIDEIVAPDASTEDVAGAIARAVRQAPDVEHAAEGVAEQVPVALQRGSIVAVWGPTGAPGRTTVAVSLAYEFARAGGAVLVDADTYGGAVAQALGMLDEAPGIAALARASLHGTLGDDTVRRHALEAAPGLRVLSGITRAERWPELSAAALEPVWELLRAHSPVTVVDCGFSVERDEELQYDTRAPQRNGATLSALAAADVVVVVGSAEPLGVQRLVHGLSELDSVAPEDVTPRVVVVNRVRAAVAGDQPRQAIADALKRFAGVDTVLTIGWDPRACDAATLSGQALGERAPRSAARKSMQAIGREVRRVCAARSRVDVPAPAAGATLGV